MINDFDDEERPTKNPRKDRDFQLGTIMRDVVESKEDIVSLHGRVILLENQFDAFIRQPRPRVTMRPHVQTGVVGGLGAGTIIGIFEVLRQLGILK